MGGAAALVLREASRRPFSSSRSQALVTSAKTAPGVPMTLGERERLKMCPRLRATRNGLKMCPILRLHGRHRRSASLQHAARVFAARPPSCRPFARNLGRHLSPRSPWRNTERSEVNGRQARRPSGEYWRYWRIWSEADRRCRRAAARLDTSSVPNFSCGMLTPVALLCVVSKRCRGEARSLEHRRRQTSDRRQVRRPKGPGGPSAEAAPRFEAAGERLGRAGRDPPGGSSQRRRPVAQSGQILASGCFPQPP